MGAKRPKRIIVALNTSQIEKHRFFFTKNGISEKNKAKFRSVSKI